MNSGKKFWIPAMTIELSDILRWNLIEAEVIGLRQELNDIVVFLGGVSREDSIRIPNHTAVEVTRFTENDDGIVGWSLNGTIFVELEFDKENAPASLHQAKAELEKQLDRIRKEEKYIRLDLDSGGSYEPIYMEKP